MQTSPYVKLQDSNGTVPTAGTRVQLSATSVPCAKVTLTALKTNNDEIVYGGVTVVAALGATRSGTPLVPGQSVDIPIDDLCKIWLDAIVSGDGYSYSWLS